MTESPPPNGDRWLREQKSVISELFEKAAGELESVDVRLRTGSSAPVLEETSNSQRIYITPIRRSQEESDGVFALALIATTRRGPRRYEAILEMSGPQTLEALRHLAEAHADVWRRVYFHNGFWLARGATVDPLIETQQLTEDGSQNLAIVAAFLHSGFPRTIVEGMMLLGTLYRCIFDELSGASRMIKMCNVLTNKLGGQIPRLRTDIRPLI